MESCLPRYLTKSLLFLLALVVSFTVILNISLFIFKPALDRVLDKYSFKSLSFKGAYFLPPNFIFLRGVSFKDPRIIPPETFAVVPASRLDFSWLELIQNERLSVSTVSLYGPKIEYKRLQGMVFAEFRRIADFIRGLPRQDIQIRVKSALLEAGKGSRQSGLDAVLTLSGEHLFSSGRWHKKEDEAWPLDYRFKGFWVKDNLIIESLELKREKALHLELWGGLKGNILEFKGFSFLSGSRDYNKSKAVLERKAVSQYRRKFKIPDDELSWVKVYILDIDCRMDFSLSKVTIPRFDCAINNNPVSLKGEIGLGDGFSLNAAISCGMADFRNPSSARLKQSELNLNGRLKDRVFKGQAGINMDFSGNEDASGPLENLNLSFKGLRLYFARHKQVRIAADEVNCFSRTKSNAYKASLNGFEAGVYLGHDRYKMVRFNSRFYDGLLSGQARLDAGVFPLKAYASLRVKAVSANRLDGILEHFSKVSGRLSSRMNFHSHPEAVLKGDITIDRGSLNDFDFFNWLGDYFELPSLKRVGFDSAAANFTVDESGVGLQDIRLSSPDVGLKGYFKLGTSDLVSSRLSMTLSRRLLRDSKRFLPLLNIIGRGFPALTFSFQLSGSLHNMNFQWLRSELKKKLQDSIPDFIERHIEGKIEQAIDFAP